MSIDRDVLEDGPLGLRFKGLPPDAAALTADELAAQRRPLFGGGFSWPLMTLRTSAVEHNADLLAAYAARFGLGLAPHLKTSMSPRLADYALRRGAWGVTVATPHQARVFMAAGVHRVFLANQLFDAALIADAGEWARVEDREFVCQVDSVAGVERLSASATAPVDVVIEVGHAGGRTGARDADTFEDVRAAALAAPNVTLRGVTAYEGSLSHSREKSELERVREFLREVRDLAARLAADVDERGLLVSAGGSIYFDCVAQVLAPAAFGDTGVPTITLIRSGAYLTHDSGLYAIISPLGEETPEPAARLRSAITVWGQVLSRPEPDVVIVGAGRRDLNWDADLPTPHEVRDRAGDHPRAATRWRTRELNDQHAFCEIPTDDPARPGDLVAFTISHPCTAHDRWTAPVLVDDRDIVVGVARCYF